VVLSIAAMWSASKACRSPKIPIPTVAQSIVVRRDDQEQSAETDHVQCRGRGKRRHNFKPTASICSHDQTAQC
jgi:hypothetical protein